MPTVWKLKAPFFRFIFVVVVCLADNQKKRKIYIDNSAVIWYNIIEVIEMKCPYCNSESIDEIDSEQFMTEYTAYFECLNCGKEFKAVYELVLKKIELEE